MIRIFKKMNLLLDTKQKAQMGGILVMMLLGGVLESAGVVAAIPVLSVVIDPTSVQTNKWMRLVYESLNMKNPTQFAIFAMVSLVLAFVIKNVYLFFLNKVELKFIYTNQFATSRRMMINFMKRPYEYYLGADTAVIQRSITSDVNNMYGLILNVIQLASECIVFACLVAVLIAQDAAMILTIAGLLIIVLLIIKFVLKPIMIKAGEDNQEYYSGLFKWIEQSVTGIKEIKVANREPYFINEYAKCGEGYVQAVQKYNIFNSTPRLLIETVCIAGLVFYMMAQMLSGASVSQMLPQLTVFGLAAMRLLPSANRINNYLTNISYFEPFFMGVTDDLQSEIHDADIDYDADSYIKIEDVAKLPVHESIELKDIVYHYPDTDVYVFDHANMSIPVGHSVGIVGTSGAGKTTIVNIMLGLLTIESGQILADGVEVRDHYRQWLKNIGYIPQNIFMIDASIRQNVAFGIPADEIDEDKVWAALKEAQMDEYVRSLPDGLDTGIGERGIRLSGGQRQRIGIARALYEDPEVLVLDEATSALDNETETAIMESINRLHGLKTLIIIAHRLQTIEKCDMVYRVEDGKIVKV